ncbi:hypothetical protein RB195_010109 [Necator americanus]|uniref:Uncharacterized protein n=1 Tax=Necator americanus TaxID=51031 RepID=A0ABR1CXP3_NECAM
MTYGTKVWAAPSTMMAKVDCIERKLLRRLLGYFWPKACQDLYAEIDVKIKKVGQSYGKGRYTSAKMWVIASGDDISPPIRSRATGAGASGVEEELA